MQKNHTEVWERCLGNISQHVNHQCFRTWFEPIRPVRLDENVFTLLVPNKFFYEWLEEHYLGLLKTTIRQEVGEKIKLEYQILVNDYENKASNAKGNGKVDETLQDLNPEPAEIKNPFVIPGIKKWKVDSQLNVNFVFNNYIEGDCNRLARSAGLAIAKKPGQTAFNPLVIYGDVGLGKTHLANAIGNEVVSTLPSKTVLYVTSDNFTNQLIQSIRNGGVNDFVSFYQQIDLLIVDDIQFLANKQKTQEIFFHIFNQLHQSGKQIVLTSDRPPRDLDGMEERLISRFKWGLTADLQAPDLETRMAILEHKMMQEGMGIPPNVIEFICFNIKNNIRELEGVLNLLMAQASLNRREIDVDLAREVIKNFVHEINKEITVENIQKLVAEHLQIPTDALFGKTRKRSIVIARQLSMYLAKTMTDNSLKNIGEIFGGRDHSTVIYSIRTVQDLMETDSYFRETVHELEKKIKNSLREA